MNDATDVFSDNYVQARDRFRIAVARAGGRLDRHNHPAACGPDGEVLSIDVGVFGPDEAPRALLIVSGTHGGEGYAGSAAQLALLAAGDLETLPADVRVVLVHGLNPYGFAHGSRTTEDHVDLNRNFVDFRRPLPANPAYAELHDALCPDHWTPASRANAAAALDAWVAVHGHQRWMEGVMRGQWSHPTGLTFGGVARTWPNRTLEAIVTGRLAAARQLAFIDWHTGLGEYGRPFFLCFNERGGPAWERCCDWWGHDAVAGAQGYDGAKRPEYAGLVFQGVQRFAPQAEMAGAVIEFGTGPIAQGLDRLRADRWLRFGHGDRDAATLAALRREVLAGFYPPDPDWRRDVVPQALAIERQALAGLAAW